MTKFYRTTIKVVVLSEFPYDPSSLEQVHNDITFDGCSGQWNVTKSEELTPKKMARALRMQGSIPEFFGIDEHGNRIE